MQLKVNKLNFIYIIFVLVIAIICFYILNIDYEFNDIDNFINITSLIGIIEIFLCLIIWKKYTGTFLSLFIFYLLSFYLFTMGQSFLRLFNLKYNFFNIYEYIEPNIMLKVHIFTIFCIAFLFEGALIAVGEKKGNKKRNIFNSNELGKVGIFLFFISIIPMLIYLVKLILAYRIGGYSYAFSSVANSSGIMRVINKIHPFFIPALIMIIIDYKNKKRKFAMLLMASIGIIYFFIGERTGAASILLSLFILNSQLNDKNKNCSEKLEKFKIALVVFLFAILIPTVGALRNSASFSLFSFSEVMKRGGVFSGFIDTIAIMGYSAFPLGKTIEIIPLEKGYSYGKTYFFAILAILPNIFGGVHISVKYAGLAQWLMNYLRMNYGPGFSYPAEAWFNFGWYGCIIMLVIGYIFCKYMYVPNSLKKHKISLFISTAFFLETITSPRRELMTVIRLVGYYVFIPVLLVYILKKCLKNSYKNKRKGN